MKILQLGLMIMSLIGSHVSGWAMPILAVMNFLWLLVKDVTLFPWVWLLYVGFIFIASVIASLAASVWYHMSE